VSPVAVGPEEGASPHEDASAACGATTQAPAQAGFIESPPQTMQTAEHTAMVLVPDPAAPGGFRRMKIRFQANGVAAG